MRELEQLIIGSCFGEDQYKKVSFLEPEDFTNYPGKPYREFFKILKATGAKENVFLEALVKTKNTALRMLVAENFHALGANNPDRIGLKLLEVRFQTLFADLLTLLSSNSKSTVERELLNTSLMSIHRVDIFDLSDNIIEYLGAHIGVNTKSRIESFIKYRNKRVQNAKEVINES